MLSPRSTVQLKRISNMMLVLQYHFHFGYIGHTHTQHIKQRWDIMGNIRKYKARNDNN